MLSVFRKYLPDVHLLLPRIFGIEKMYYRELKLRGKVYKLRLDIKSILNSLLQYIYFIKIKVDIFVRPQCSATFNCTLYGVNFN